MPDLAWPRYSIVFGCWVVAQVGVVVLCLLLRNANRTIRKQSETIDRLMEFMQALQEDDRSAETKGPHH